MSSYAGGLEGAVIFRGAKGLGGVEGDVHWREASVATPRG